MKKIVFIFLVIMSGASHAALETTPYGKITGIETRSWGMHLQVDFPVGQHLGCPAIPGQTYMLDLTESKVSQAGGNFDFIQSVVLAAFLTKTDISFHLYECGVNRPLVGHVRVRK